MFYKKLFYNVAVLHLPLKSVKNTCKGFLFFRKVLVYLMSIVLPSFGYVKIKSAKILYKLRCTPVNTHSKLSIPKAAI